MRRTVIAILMTIVSCLAFFTVGASPAQALTSCQRELPYSISVVQPQRVYYDGGGFRLNGRVNVWDNDMDGCFLTVCLQQRINGTWGSRLVCAKWEMRYANFDYHWSYRYFTHCGELNDSRDDFRTTAKLAESTSWLVGPVRDVC